jgi:hypothetical protein
MTLSVKCGVPFGSAAETDTTIDTTEGKRSVPLQRRMVEPSHNLAHARAAGLWRNPDGGFTRSRAPWPLAAVTSVAAHLSCRSAGCPA